MSDPRSEEVLLYRCTTDLSVRELTLFANGTLRLRMEEGEERSMRLAELAHDELEAYLRRLASADLSEVDPIPSSGSGLWVGRCELRWDSEEVGRPRVYRFSNFDSLQLGLAQVVRIAEELVGVARERAPVGRLPRDYEPRQGDVLVRADGERFEVVGETDDGRGVELVGVEQPLTLYVLKEAIRSQFLELVERR